MTGSRIRLGPPVPRQAPPFPPAALVARRRRLVAFGVLAVCVLAAFAALTLEARLGPPPAPALTGQPLPGLDPDPGDAGWREAPAEAFTEIAWTDLRGLALADSFALEVTIPDSFLALSGRPVRIRGFMVPLDEGDRTLDFIVVPDLGRCWFCDTPDPARTVYARGAFGSVPSVYDRPVSVSGILDVGTHLSGRRFHSALRLRAVRVEVL